jgi:hypothetical protein
MFFRVKLRESCYYRMIPSPNRSINNFEKYETAVSIVEFLIEDVHSVFFLNQLFRCRFIYILHKCWNVLEFDIPPSPKNKACQQSAIFCYMVYKSFCFEFLFRRYGLRKSVPCEENKVKLENIWAFLAFH